MIWRELDSRERERLETERWDRKVGQQGGKRDGHGNVEIQSDTGCRNLFREA